ncbi:MAG: WG repeat-containing protein [Catalinimonas sp.]
MLITPSASPRVRLLRSYLPLLLGLFVLPAVGWAQGGYECEELLFPKRGARELYGYTTLLNEWRVEPTFTRAEPFQGRYAVVMKGKRYGVLNCEGYLAVPAEYDEIKNFSEGTGWVRKGQRWGLVSERGKLLLPVAYDAVRPITPYHPLHWLQRGRGGQPAQWGLFDKSTGKFVVTPRYDAVQILSIDATLVRAQNDFGVMRHDGSFAVPMGAHDLQPVSTEAFAYRRNGRVGAFNVRGRVLLEPAYDTVATRGGLLLFRQEGRWGMANRRGQTLVEPRFEAVGQFYEGVAAVREGGKWGLMRPDGWVVVAPTYEAAHDVRNRNWVVREGGRWGIVNQALEPVVPFRYDTIARNYAQHRFYALRRAGAYTLVDLTGKPLLAETFDEVVLDDPADFLRVRRAGVWSYYDAEIGGYVTRENFTAARPRRFGYAFVQQAGGWGVIDTSGRVVVPTQYDSLAYVQPASRTLFVAGRAGRYGVVDDRDRTVLPIEFERVEWAAGERLFKVRRDGRWGLHGTSDVLVESRYDTMSLDAPAFPARVARRNKWGLLNAKGEEVTKLKYESLRALGAGWFAWGDGDKLGLLDDDGREAVPPTYLAIRPFENGWAAARRAEGWGFINVRAKPSTPFTYEEVTDFNGTSAYVKVNGKWGAVDRRGVYLLPPEYDGYRTLPDGTRRLYKE